MKPTRAWRIALLTLVGVLVVAAVGFVLWAGDAADPMPEALAAMKSDESVTVEQNDWIVFSPTKSDPIAGFIFYPGGKVDPRAYAPPARAIAEQGFRVVIVPMPLNLAVLAPNRADGVIESYPEVIDWSIGGHSLGGAMAARFADNRAEVVDALILWAAYPAANDDLSNSSLRVASIYGTVDGLATPEQVLAAAPQLPPATTYRAIAGGNHAQFGYYGEQEGDNPAAISRSEQQAQAVSTTLATLTNAP